MNLFEKQYIHICVPEVHDLVVRSALFKDSNVRYDFEELRTEPKFYRPRDAYRLDSIFTYFESLKHHQIYVHIFRLKFHYTSKLQISLLRLSLDCLNFCL